MTQIEKLRIEVISLSSVWFQAIGEVDGLLDTACKILDSFESSDWKILNSELAKMSDRQLQVLADVVMNDYFENDLLEKCQTFSSIFLILELAPASYIFHDHIELFFFQLPSAPGKNLSDLLNKMKPKVEKLKDAKYLSEKEHSYFVRQIGLNK